MKYIHLLYVPTMACNMQCRYCYLEDNTVDSGTPYTPLETLHYAVQKFREAEVIPFNISLHGGEVTTLSKKDFRELISFIDLYYKENEALITEGGFRTGRPHIKTNLYNLDRHIDTIRDYAVSVSGSLDLPFSLHDTYRLSKGGDPTMERILRNISLLGELPGKKKVSATIFREHYLRIDEIIEDIRFLEENTCLDMNDFNFMIGFDYYSGGLLTALSDKEQVDFYHRIRDAFMGTDLQEGLDTAWFAEFGPTYCTNCDICGSKFFLLERNGDIYSCVRGQKHEEFYFGNIYRNDVEEILQTAEDQILKIHRECGFDSECADCGYLYLCKTGCPFVKKLNHSAKSYTCLLQKCLYKDWGLKSDPDNPYTVYEYLSRIHPEAADEYLPPRIPHGVPPLQKIIREDSSLRYIYDSDAFCMVIDGEDYPLLSQILRRKRDYVCITPESSVIIYVRKEVLEAESRFPVNNSLYIQMLSGDMVQYGDEGRMKQRHIMNEMIYRDVLAEMPSDRDGWYRLDLSPAFQRYGAYFSQKNANNIFFTTSALRDVHYSKQKNNAFYHMQAMDLPFQNIEFYYLTMENWKEALDGKTEDI